MEVEMRLWPWNMILSRYLKLPNLEYVVHFSIHYQTILYVNKMIDKKYFGQDLFVFGIKNQPTTISHKKSRFKSRI